MNGGSQPPLRLERGGKRTEKVLSRYAKTDYRAKIPRGEHWAEGSGRGGGGLQVLISVNNILVLKSGVLKKKRGGESRTKSQGVEFGRLDIPTRKGNHKPVTGRKNLKAVKPT